MGFEAREPWRHFTEGASRSPPRQVQGTLPLTLWPGVGDPSGSHCAGAPVRAPAPVATAREKEVSPHLLGLGFTASKVYRQYPTRSQLQVDTWSHLPRETTKDEAKAQRGGWRVWPGRFQDTPRGPVCLLCPPGPAAGSRDLLCQSDITW